MLCFATAKYLLSLLSYLKVFKQLPYNEKVDVFSFGIVLFELFNRYLTLASVYVKVGHI